MTVYSIQQYRELQRQRLAMYKKNAKRGKIRGAEIYATKLRLYVPIKSGRLKRSIIRRGGNVRIGASGNQGFPYLHWINQTPGAGMTTLNVKHRDMKGNPAVRINGTTVPVVGGKMTYGLQPSNWSWTGRVRFAQVALYETRQEWRVLIQKINKKSIMVQSI